MHNGLKPWIDVVGLHPDVESGNTAIATYAIDLGALASGEPNIPVIYRDASAFFSATYLTKELKRLLTEVMGRLAGNDGDRVIQLRSPFGGGKSHTLAALYHTATNPDALSILPEASGIPNPGKVRIAVFDGEKFDVKGKVVDKGIKIKTPWGWIAWQLGGEELYQEFVAEHDRDRVAPGGDVIAKLLEGEPVLILLDEVLKYIERAMGEKVEGSTLGRQVLDFLQNLQTEVANTKNAAMVYSLQASIREAFGDAALLQMLDHMTARKDAKREPITGDEILPVLRKRLLNSPPPSNACNSIAQVYENIITHMRVAHADSENMRRLAEDEGARLRNRFANAYPFHPMLIDVMKERWASIPDFQRTRGALRFLASCMYTIKESGTSSHLIGVGDIPIYNTDVRYAFFTEVGQREPFQPVLEHDIIGPNARAKRIDAKLAKEQPALSSVRPATKLGTAILMYSFGGLPKEGSRDGETLPPGITETELIASCISPNLDSITAQVCLKDLREQCLYLHYDGVRYIFKTIPNINKLLEDESEKVRPDEDIKPFIREDLEKRLAGKRYPVILPAKSQDIKDKEPLFLTAYLPLEFLEKSESEQEREALQLLEKYGDRPRQYRNGLGLAIPNKNQIEVLRRAARYLKAIERLEGKKKQLGITKEQLDQLKERQGTERTALESAMRQLYPVVWMPTVNDNGSIDIEKVEPKGRPFQATGVHERLMELITIIQPKIFNSLVPKKIIELMQLGQNISDGTQKVGVSTRDIEDAFFSFLGFPRIADEAVIKSAILKGKNEDRFYYWGRGEPQKDAAGYYDISREVVISQQPSIEDEINFDNGFIILPQALKAAPMIPTQPPDVISPPDAPQPPLTPPERPPIIRETKENVVEMQLELNEQQLYNSFNALGNLAKKAGTLELTVKAECKDGFDPVWIRNAVLEPLDEANVKRKDLRKYES